MADETAAQRYTRDWGNAALEADRKTRELDDQSVERKSHLYVDIVTGNSAVTGAAPVF